MTLFIKYAMRMSVADVGIVMGGTLVTVVHILYHAEFWQRKEYRFDRVKSVFLSSENKSLLQISFIFGMLLVALAWIALLYGNEQASYVFASAYLLLQVVLSARQLASRGLLRPDFTFKALIVITVAVIGVVLYCILFFGRGLPAPLDWATLLLFFPYLFAVCVVLVNIPATIRKRQIIRKARHLRQSLTDLKAIGITGSFGKTSTKFFLAQLLEEKSGVVVTDEHRNSVFAVAQHMLQKLTSTTKIYIAEMGAYRKGEINELAELVQPTFGIITGIGNQHIALFGSQENILTAKWELIESLPDGGQAILNADDTRLRAKAETTNRTILWFSSKAGTSDVECTVWVENVSIETHQIRALVHVQDEEKIVHFPLLSEALLPSALAAATAASSLGIPAHDIFSKLEKLRPYEQTMEKRTGPHNSFVIDDSYSANEQGVLIALQHLQRFANKKKILVLRPLEELGREGAAVHQRIGKAIATSGIDLVFIVNHNYEAILKKTITSSPNAPLVFVSNDARDLAQRINKTVTNNTVILLEGRMPDVVRKSLII